MACYINTGGKSVEAGSQSSQTEFSVSSFRWSGTSEPLTETPKTGGVLWNEPQPGRWQQSRQVNIQGDLGQVASSLGVSVTSYAQQKAWLGQKSNRVSSHLPTPTQSIGRGFLESWVSPLLSEKECWGWLLMSAPGTHGEGGSLLPWMSKYSWRPGML